MTTKFYGGISNNLFQAAACISYGIKHKMPYCLPTKIENPHYDRQKPYITSRMNVCDENLNLPVYLEPNFTYAEIPYMADICLQGYWQSRFYIEPYRDEVLDIFDIPYQYKEGWVAVHIRRGDYLLYPTMHPVVTKEYILDAMDYFRWLGYKNFLVFGDDLNWNKENVKLAGVNIEFSEGKTELEDLSLASSCECVVGCNSSFSWWIYYLNQCKTKKAVFPRKNKWFGKDLAHNVDDLYFPLPKWVLR